MISVEFSVECNITNDEHIKHAKSMSWFEYLVMHAVDIKIKRNYNPVTDLDLVIYHFYLKDVHETIYRLKYNSY